MTTPTEICARLMRAAADSYGPIPSEEAADMRKAAALIAAQAADIERLTEELRASEWHKNNWHGCFEKQHKRAQAAEASLAAVEAERDAMREALIGARAAIKAFHGPLMWEIYGHHAPEMKAIDAALSLDAQVKS